MLINHALTTVPQKQQPRKEHVLKGQGDGIAFLSWSPDDSLLLTCGREDNPEAIVFSSEVRKMFFKGLAW